MTLKINLSEQEEKRLRDSLKNYHPDWPGEPHELAAHFYALALAELDNEERREYRQRLEREMTETLR